ncbi:transporter substrate-binding domain-containing protein [Leifsonia sp. F6_8S_P_1B]|uniref:Transporter substrate-binding domain-containing protein n=1 Tax=Leifsonia williamsii TaxID=3035919 RepID=A0ABT8K8Q0_9MICO|nr:transporter substrate-binding domain-containing protein [Leifsonia williamsii]MDN4613836.1 transporter substrate-binding domain-containing protein [Leifsonia williamsii]
MKKLVASFCTAAALAVTLAGCASGSSAGGGSSASAGPEGLVQPGKLTACIDPEYAPLEYYKNGTDGDIVGFDADGIRALAKHWGVETNLLVTSFDGLMPQLQSGACDMIFGGLYMTDERLKIADASAVMQAGPAILTSPDRVKDITSPSDLCGLTVAAQSASSNAATIKTLSEKCTGDGAKAINLVEYPKTAETVLAVLNGKADALAETNVAAAYMVTQNKGKLEIAPDVLELDTQFGVFSRKDDKISASIASGLKALREDGTLADIAKTYGLDPAIVEVK